MKKAYWLILSAMFLAGCLGNWLKENPENLYLKKIRLQDGELQWYYHSLISNTTPDWIVIRYNDGMRDTLCHSGSIVDIELNGRDTIKIWSYGQPELYNVQTEVKATSRGYTIALDASGNWTPPRPRAFKDTVATY